MSIASLSKFGVPDDGNASGTGMLQPKLQYKFRVTFTNFAGIGTDSKTLTREVMTMSRPTLEETVTEVHSYNSIAYVRGKHAWSTVDITFRDDLENNVVHLIGEQVQKQMNHFEQLSAAAGKDYKFEMVMESLDGQTASPLERWELDGCFISNYTTPSGDYSSSDLNQITMTVRCDNAVHIDDWEGRGGPFYESGTLVPRGAVKVN